MAVNDTFVWVKNLNPLLYDRCRIVFTLHICTYGDSRIKRMVLELQEGEAAAMSIFVSVKLPDVFKEHRDLFLLCVSIETSGNL